MCLGRTFSRRSGPFEDYDYHLASKNAQAGDAGTLSISLDFAEEKPNEWSAELIQSIPEVVVVHDGDIRHVTLRVMSEYDKVAKDFVTDWEFLDKRGKGLGPKSKTPIVLSSVQRLSPVFYLPALRDAANDFGPRSRFWAPFLRNPSIDPKTRDLLEKDLNQLNDKIIDAHTSLKIVQEKLAKTCDVVALGSAEPVSIEALPGRVSDMLSRTQVTMLATTGAGLPLARHGAGTQSLSVLFLFEAFLSTMLSQVYDRLSEPILALEEPEAHLHPSAIRSLWSIISSMKGQKVIATHSGDLLSEVPLSAVRRFYRSDQGISVQRLRAGTLNANDVRKIESHIKSTRAELLFSRCWLLCEGETEVWVLKDTAAILGIDLERAGVRLVIYGRIGAETLVKVANDLKIHWCLVADGDKSGKDYVHSITPHLEGRVEAKHVILLPASNMEVYLCKAGCGDAYLAHMSAQKEKLLTSKPGDPEYWDRVCKCLDRTPKETMALEAMMIIKKRGKNAVPKELKGAILSAVALSEIA